MSFRFDEKWISDTQLAVTWALAGDTNNLKGHVVEIGVHQGRSAIGIAYATMPGVLHAVDDWSGRDLGVHANARDNRAIWEANVAAAPHLTVVTWWMDWREWIAGWSLPLRFAHIDAHHTTKEVADQIDALRPLMVPGGVLCGDDFGKAPVAEAVRDRLSQFAIHEDLWWIYA